MDQKQKLKSITKQMNDENRHINKAQSSQKITDLVDEAKRIYTTFKKQIKGLNPNAKLERLKNEQENSWLKSQWSRRLQHQQDTGPQKGRADGRRRIEQTQKGNEAAT